MEYELRILDSKKLLGYDASDAGMAFTEPILLKGTPIIWICNMQVWGQSIAEYGECMERAINHEIVHFVLWKLFGIEICRAYDDLGMITIGEIDGVV